MADPLEPVKVAVVVAKFREDTWWTNQLPPEWDLFVYDKSDGSIPNVGREAETYARFLVEHYDRLGDWDYVVFLQGHPFDHLRRGQALPTSAADLVPGQVTSLGWDLVADAHGAPHHPGLPVAQAHELVLGQPHHQGTWTFCAGAQYVVPAANLMARGRAFWEHVRSLLATDRVCAGTMERLWLYAFRPIVPA